jgi:predicted PurR-regulated permease PerM
VVVVLLGLLSYFVYRVFEPFLVPLIWAVVLVVFFQRLHARVRRTIQNPNLAALTTTLILTAILIVPMGFVFSLFTNQAIAVTQRVVEDWKHGEGWRSVFGWLQRLLQFLPFEIKLEDLRNFAGQNLRQWGLGIAERAGMVAQNVLGVTVNVLVTLLACFYLFRDGPALMQTVRDIAPLDADYRERLLAITENVLFASVLSSFAVAAVQGTLGGIAFWMVGIPGPALWGIVMMLASFIPLVGASLIWGPAAIYFLFGGAYLKAGILVAVGVLVIGTVDNILRPILISGRVELNGLLVLISVVGGIGAFGLLGIVLGPVLIAVAAAVVAAERERRAGLSPPAGPRPVA